MKKAFYISFFTLSFLFFQKAGTTPIITIGEISLQPSPGDLIFSEEMPRAFEYTRSANMDVRELCDGSDDEENLDENGDPKLDDNDEPIVGDNYKSCPSTYANYAEYITTVGYAEAALNGIDCRDNDPDINPGADEICDGKDNNCDGVIDNDDPGVYCTETDQCGNDEGCKEAACSDSPNDQDGDGDFDCDDTDCAGTDVCTESGLDEEETAASTDDKDVDECSDGNDDDHDSKIDCADDDCATDPACLEQDTECGNGLNDDGDLDSEGNDIIDCQDPDCTGSEACLETGSTECSNGDDDDDDGLFDCDDDDCAEESVCDPKNLDDDGDGFTENQGDDDDTNPKLWFTSGSLSADNDGDGYSENDGDCDDTSTDYSLTVDEICDDTYNRDENCDGVALTHEDFGKSASFDMSAIQYLSDPDVGRCISADYVPFTEVPPSCSFHIE